MSSRLELADDLVPTVPSHMRLRKRLIAAGKWTLFVDGGSPISR